MGRFWMDMVLKIFVSFCKTSKNRIPVEIMYVGLLNSYTSVCTFYTSIVGSEFLTKSQDVK